MTRMSERKVSEHMGRQSLEYTNRNTPQWVFNITGKCMYCLQLGQRTYLEMQNGSDCYDSLR